MTHSCKAECINIVKKETKKLLDIRNRKFNITNTGAKLSCPTARHGDAWGERKYTSYSFTNSALDGVSG
jgi:hypothetical protein